MRKPWPTALSISLLLAVPFALFLPALLMGKLIYGYDLLALGLPFDREVKACLAAHQWPLWMPDLLGGMPGIASCNLTFAYPTAWLGYLAGGSLGPLLNWDAALQLALSGTGMFLLLRRLDRSVQASLLGAVLFEVSGTQISQLNGGYENFVEGIAMLPWAFWAAHKACQEKSWFAWGLCGLAFGLQILAVAAQLFVYSFAAVALFALALPPSGLDGGGRWRRLLPTLQGLSLAVGLAFLISAPQLWPTLQYLPLCERHGYSYLDFLKGSFGCREFMTWLVPGLFGWQEPTYVGAMGACFTSEYLGLLPWALAAAGLAALWGRDRRVRWFAGLAVAAAFFAQRDWAPFCRVFLHLPILNALRLWTRVLFLTTFAVCCLAAFGWDELRAGPQRRRAWWGAAGFVVLAAAAVALALAWIRWAGLPGGAQNLGGPEVPKPATQAILGLAHASAWRTLSLLPALLGVLWLATRRLGVGLALTLALAFHAQDLSQMTGRFIHFVDPGVLQQQNQVVGASPPPAGAEPYRVVDNGASTNRVMALGYESLGGTESVKMRSFLSIIQAMAGRRAAWLNLFNVRYVLVADTPDWSRMRFTVNRGAYPRAWLVGRCRVVAGDDDAYALLADPGFDPRREVALAADPGLRGGEPKGSVTWLERSPAAETLDVSTDRDAVLVLSNSWYPSWRCRVDGADSPVLKADGGLQAVALKAGRHRLDFYFDATLFNAALAAAALGLALLLALGLAQARSRAGGRRMGAA